MCCNFSVKLNQIVLLFSIEKTKIGSGKTGHRRRNAFGRSDGSRGGKTRSRETLAGTMPLTLIDNEAITAPLAHYMIGRTKMASNDV